MEHHLECWSSLKCKIDVLRLRDLQMHVQLGKGEEVLCEGSKVHVGK